jgi:hypothetical protein
MFIEFEDFAMDFENGYHSLISQASEVQKFVPTWMSALEDMLEMLVACKTVRLHVSAKSCFLKDQL